MISSHLHILLTSTRFIRPTTKISSNQQVTNDLIGEANDTNSLCSESVQFTQQSKEVNSVKEPYTSSVKMADNEAAAYVFLEDAGHYANENITEIQSILQVLHWIGFRIEAQRIAVFEDSFNSWDDVRLLTEKDADNMASSFASRSQNNGRIIFGTARTKRVKALIHWVQDTYRISR